MPAAWGPGAAALLAEAEWAEMGGRLPGAAVVASASGVALIARP